MPCWCLVSQLELELGTHKNGRMKDFLPHLSHTDLIGEFAELFLDLEYRYCKINSSVFSIHDMHHVTRLVLTRWSL